MAFLQLQILTPVDANQILPDQLLHTHTIH